MNTKGNPVQICLLVAGLLLALPAVAQAQFTFKTNWDGTIAITGYTGAGGEVVIPGALDGTPIIGIEWTAFNESSNVTSIIIPDNILYLGGFHKCSALTNVTIGSGVTGIGFQTFYLCTNLACVTIGSSVTIIDICAFQYCHNLKNMIIPNNVLSIGHNAFEACGLTNVTIGNGVVSIGDSAFSSCGNLASITLPTKITTIGNIFQYCYRLRSIVIPDSVTNIASFTFEWCYGLTNVTLSSNIDNISDGLFYCCGDLRAVTIPSRVSTIGANAFGYCTNLASISFPKRVASIGDFAFQSCSSLTNITIPTSVTNIGVCAFGFCTNLASITVPAFNLFYSGTNGALFDKDQTTILQCPGGYFGSYVIPDSVATIGKYAFFGCVRITDVSLPYGVASIADDAFLRCVSLTNIFIPDTVTNIGASAFDYCNGITSITIPNSVKTLGYFALGGCASYTNLISVFFVGNAPASGSEVFDIYSKTIVYYLPGTTGWSNTFARRPTMLWNPKAQTSDGNFGVKTNCFGFNITGTTNIPMVVEACTNFGGAWMSLQSISLTNGSFYFSDPQWTNYAGRFYRLRSP